MTTTTMMMMMMMNVPGMSDAAEQQHGAAEADQGVGSTAAAALRPAQRPPRPASHRLLLRLDPRSATSDLRSATLRRFPPNSDNNLRRHKCRRASAAAATGRPGPISSLTSDLPHLAGVNFAGRVEVRIGPLLRMRNKKRPKKARNACHIFKRNLKRYLL